MNSRQPEDTAAEDTAAATSQSESSPDRLHQRAAAGIKRPHNWVQLIKFGAVGASGYVVNLIVYELARQGAGVHYMLAAVIAFCFAVLNNFWWNRHWTFDASEGHAGFQATRFFVVSLVALGFNLALLKIFVAVLDINELPAQALAIACVTPVNFIGNKLWSFRL